MESSDVSRIILYLLIMITDLTAVKVPYYERTGFCGIMGLVSADIISNGNYSDVEQIDKICVGPAYIRIDLKNKFEVQYVVVYEGKADEGKNADQLDYFKVEVGDKQFMRCSEYPFTSRGPNKGGMRVNCEFLDVHDGVKSVVLRSRINKGFYLSEIEIHNLASDKHLTKLLLYHGCFKNIEGVEGSIISSLTGCQDKCISEKYSLVAIKSNMCKCANQYELSDRLPDKNCNKECYEGYTCGGDNAFSLYIVLLQLPNYFGCFEAFGFAYGTLINGTITILDCLHHCNNYFYAMLQNGDTCFCWDNIIKTKRNEDNYNKCTSKCTGALKTFCGAEDYVSIYETCIRVNYNFMKCSELFQCADEYNVFGECRRGCKPGYKGLHCLESDGTFEIITTSSTTATQTTTTPSSTTKNKTATTSEIPSTTKIQTRIYSGLTNLTRGITNAIITDYFSIGSSDIDTSEIDLCLILNPCKNVSNSYCVMHKKKAICACTIGYSKNPNTDVCEDIDECEMKPCDSSSTTCTNLNGSYICDCNEGYVRATDEICLKNTKNVLQRIEVEMEKIDSWINLKFILGVFILCIGAIGVIYVCRRPPEDVQDN